MKLLVILALAGFTIWLAWTVHIAKVRSRLHSSDRLRQAAIAAIMHRLESLLPSDIRETYGYSVAAEFLQLGFVEGLVGNAKTEDEAVQEALNYVEAALAAPPNAVEKVLSRVRLPERPVESIGDIVVSDPGSAGVLMLRVIEDATSLLEKDRGQTTQRSQLSQRSIRLCAAECVSRAAQANPAGPTSTFLLKKDAERALEDAVRTYGSLQNAVSALAA